MNRMLLMSGTLLSSMYDEAFTAKDNCWGLLYGSRTSRVVSSISDAREETSKVDNHISITAYESFRVPSVIFCFYSFSVVFSQLQSLATPK